MEQKSFFSKYFKSSEEVVSMFLGLVIVLVVVGMVVNYFQKRRGSVEIAGLFDNRDLSSDQVKTGSDDNDTTIQPSTSYKVKANDSLWKIAVATYGDGYAWTKIAKENNLINPGILTVNQELKLPAMVNVEKNESISKEEVISVSKSHKVVRGDSLWKIAVATYGDGYTWTKIWKKNEKNLPDPNKLEIGMILMLE